MSHKRSSPLRATDDAVIAKGAVRRGRTLLALSLVLLAVAIGWMLGGSPVGHFRSIEDKRRFLAAYTRAFAQLPQAERITDVRTRFGMVRVYRFASARPDEIPLLLLPGRAAPTPVWADNLPGLLARGPVYAIDLLGEPGMSIQDTPITSTSDQAAWLHDVLAQLPDAELHVVGLSIGGWTAMNLAVHEPAKIATLTLIEPVFVFANLTVEAIVRSIPASVPWVPRRFRDGFNSWTAGGAPVSHDPVADMIEAGMSTYSLALPPPGLVDAAGISALTIPTLVILAGDSPMHDAGAAAVTAKRLLRNGTVKIYPGTSHAISGERPADLAADIAAHAAARGTAAAASPRH